MENPYDKHKQEAMYLAFEHGLNSLVEEENPYADMPEMAAADKAWKQGFKSNKKKAKVVKPSPLTEQEMMPVESTEKEVLTVSTLSDDLLLAELKRRKQSEYKKLLLERSSLEETLHKVETQINNLELLFGM